jgi:serine/threonine protein kinase
VRGVRSEERKAKSEGVSRAKDTRIEREVAIKVLSSAFSADSDRLRRFEQEARATGRLNHPNILAIYDVGTHEGSPYIVSELLEGKTLRDRLGGKALPLRKAIDYALQIAHGLAAAHEKDIVHRDLKPENLFVTRDGRVKILDFGLAKLQPKPGSVADTQSPTQILSTEPGLVLGTVGYMSPEQVRGQSADHRSDIFAFGAIVYEMISGERAFQGKSAAETSPWMGDSSSMQTSFLKHNWICGYCRCSAIGSPDPFCRPSSTRCRGGCLRMENGWLTPRMSQGNSRSMSGHSQPLVAYGRFQPVAASNPFGGTTERNSFMLVARKSSWQCRWKRIPPTSGLVPPKSSFECIFHSHGPSNMPSRLMASASWPIRSLRMLHLLQSPSWSTGPLG